MTTRLGTASRIRSGGVVRGAVPSLVRTCPVCGRSLDGRRSDAAFCSGSCRAAASRLRRLLAGEPVGGYSCLLDLLAAGRPKRRTKPRDKLATRPTRTSRAAEFVRDRIVEAPGHRSRARHLHAAYLGWCREAEPDQPLSYSAFLRVVEAWAPFENRVIERRPGKPGRGTLVFVGVRATQAQALPRQEG